MVAVFPDI